MTLIGGVPEKEWRKNWERQRYLKAVQRMIDYLGDKCAECGSTEGLEIDHRDRASKAYNVRREWKRPLDELKDELDKCQLLCHEHHLIKTSAERETWRHGTIHGYQNKKCRCDACKAAQSEWMKEYRRQRKIKLAAVKASGTPPI